MSPRQLSREEADRELARRRAEADGIGAGLVTLDDHSGYRLLTGANLAGETARRWAECGPLVARLWSAFDALRATLEQAQRVRDRRIRPGRAELEELSHLLGGKSVHVSGQSVPLGRRGLLDGTHAVRLLTIDDAVAEMTRDWTPVARTVAEAEEAWGTLLPAVERAGALIGRGEALLAAVPSPQHARTLAVARERWTAAQQAVAADPIGQAQGQIELSFDPDAAVKVGGVDLTELERSVQPAVQALTELKDLQDRYEERIRALEGALDTLSAQEDETARRRAHVLNRVAADREPAVPREAARLRPRLAPVRDQRARADWAGLAAALDRLERDTDQAGGNLRAVRNDLDALLARRDELRGRLASYRAMAVGLGRGEDPAADARYQAARAELTRHPCALDTAAAAVELYTQTVLGEPSAARSNPRRAEPGSGAPATREAVREERANSAGRSARSHDTEGST